MSQQYDFSDQEIIHTVSQILGQVADKQSQVLQRSDIQPTLDKETGVWYELNPDGDPHCIGFGFIVLDAVDADDGKPFITAIKVNKQHWNRDPKAYSMGIIKVVGRGMQAMEDEMKATARYQLKRGLDLGNLSMLN